MGSIETTRMPIYKSILIVIILLSMVALMLGNYLNFLPSPETDRWGKYSAVLLSIIIVFFYFNAVRNKKIDFSLGRSNNKTKRWILHAIMPIFTFWSCYIGCAYGLGWMLHSFSNYPGVIHVTVCKKHTGSRSGRSLEFKEYNYLWYKQLQYLPKEEWEHTQIGDTVRITGTKSVFGFRPYAIEY